MLMPSLDKVANMLAATPAWLRIPTPTIETLATRSSATTPSAPIAPTMSPMTRSARWRSPRGRVKEMSVSPSRLMFCTIMSTTMFWAPRLPNPLGGGPGPVRGAQDGALPLGPVVGDPRDPRLFHAVVLPRHQRARVRLERRPHVDGHAVLLRELDGAGLQHLGAEARHLEHLVV